MDFTISKIAPEIILTVGGILVLAVGLAMRKRMSAERVGVFSPETASVLVMLAALASSGWLLYRIGLHKTAGSWQFGGVYAVDGLAVFLKILALVSTIVVVFLSVDYFRRMHFHRGEYYALLVFSALAISTLAASTDMIVIYLSLEFLSITSYILVGYLKQDSRSNEAALKYFLYGSVAAAVMIYGMSMLYGLTGTTNIIEIANALRAGMPSYHALFMSAFMVLVGFGFKIAMVPFHQWAPDTYEGAPTPITAFLSVGSKAAGFAVLVRVMATGITAVDVPDLMTLVIALSAITMSVGNTVAIAQSNIKRMLAYSSIAQAGYLLLGVAAISYSRIAVPSVLLYLMIYTFMNLGAFAVVIILSGRLESDELADYAGLVKRAPFAAFTMAIFLLSLAGIPPTAGLLGKWYLFMAAINVSRGTGNPALFWLAVVAIINTVISVYYYMNVVRLMFFVKSKYEAPLPVSRPLNLVLGLSLAMTILMLVYSQPFIALANLSARMLARL